LEIRTPGSGRCVAPASLGVMSSKSSTIASDLEGFVFEGVEGLNNSEPFSRLDSVRVMLRKAVGGGAFMLLHEEAPVA
jgi:hypothetical protein